MPLFLLAAESMRIYGAAGGQAHSLSKMGVSARRQPPIHPN
jgi:hypothetical protein